MDSFSCILPTVPPLAAAFISAFLGPSW